MAFIRNPRNPIITTYDVKPSRPNFEVVGAFNAGVTRYQNETILVLRVAQRPINNDPQTVAYPLMSPDGELEVKTVSRSDSRYDLNDSRFILNKQTDEVVLTSISQIRLARSPDGINFTVDNQPWLVPTQPYESFGVEDGRVTPIDGDYYINYSAVSPLGISTGLARTHDFASVERCGIIFPPSNRDVTLFPSRVHNQYICYHRPMPSPFGGLNIWLARSPDLLHWGEHQLVLHAEPDGWEGGRVGGGAPPIETKEGWLSIYHAADKQHRYCLGAFLTPLDAPERIIKRTFEPFFWPEASYETDGFFGKVVFSCGALLENDTLRLYYGAADEVMALAEAPLETLMGMMRPI